MNPIFLSYFTMTTALTSLGYQLVLAGKVHELTGSGLRAQALSLSAFLLGLVFGGLHLDKLRLSEKFDGRKLLLKSEIFVTLTGILSLPLISIVTTIFLVFGNLQMVAPVNIPSSFIYLICLPLLLILGYFSGLQLPTILQMFNEKENKLLFLNYGGSLLAGPFINIFLNQSVEWYLQLLFFGMLNLINITYLIFSIGRAKFSIGLFSCLASMIILLNFFPAIEKIEKSSYYYGHKIHSIKQIPSLLSAVKGYGKIQTTLTPYQKIDLVLEPSVKENLFDGNLTLYLNQKPQFSLRSQALYHESMVRGAFNLNSSIPKKILVLGAGDGILVSRLLKFKEVEEITLIELDSKMIDISTNNHALSNTNGSVFNNKDPRLKVKIEDAISFLKRTKQRYDAAFVDFPFPYSTELVKLFSLEFYLLLKSKLIENGFMVMDYPLFKKSSPLFVLSKRIMASIKKSGFNNVFLFGPNTPFLYANKRIENATLDFDYSKLEEASLSTLKNLVGINHQFEKSEIEGQKILSLFMTGRLP